MQFKIFLKSPKEIIMLRDTQDDVSQIPPPPASISTFPRHGCGPRLSPELPQLPLGWISPSCPLFSHT